MIRRETHVNKQQAGDDKRAVKIFVKNLDANTSVKALKAELAALKKQLAMLEGAFAPRQMYAALPLAA